MSRVTSLPSPALPGLAFRLPCTGFFRHLSASTKTNSHAGPRLATRDKFYVSIHVLSLSSPVHTEC
jgi:hypothetical protein